ncbi:MAG: tetratricopeptide repeat protein [Acidimicrobiia bacterium]
MSACARPGCSGTIADGYCDTCGLAPLPAASAGAAVTAAVAPPVTAPPGAVPNGGVPNGAVPAGVGAPGGVPIGTPSAAGGQSGTTQLGHGTAANTGSSRVSARAASSVSRGSQAAAGSRRTVRSDTSRSVASRLGAGLVIIPPVAVTDARKSIMAVAEVPEEKRYCWKCGQAVGRTKGNRPGRTQGFCPACGSAFDFNPRLGPGLVVGGQYEVVGCLAHGGFGWIYLAVDKNVSDRPVVLKGVLNQGDTEAVEAAIAEKRFLAELEHGNVVEIYNFVEHGGAGYIVMEFVGGKSLKQVLKDRMNANGGRADPLPVDVAIGYLLGILPAMGYLHRRGYLYCDFKPDNVMHSGEDLKLIDLGGVRKIDDHDAAIYGTIGFQAPEIATDGPSVSSDLYTVVRTLAVLTLDLPGYQREFRNSLPDVANEPLFARYESFYRLLLKGTAPNPDDRFQSTDELADQLLGVLREVVATNTGQPRPAVSNRFTTDRWHPDTGAVLNWMDLPDLKPNPEDPAGSFLNEIVALDATEALARIAAERQADRVPDTIELKLRQVRAWIELQATDRARQGLAAIRAEDPWEWRVSWYDGLLALAAGDAAAAVTEFDRVRTDVPGELGPKLAAAMAAERAGDPAEAAALYQLIAVVDPGYVTAIFGLARCRAQMGDLDGAVAALQAVPAASAARTAALEQLAAWLLRRSAGTGDLGDVARAADAVQSAAVDARRRGELAVNMLAEVLDGFTSGRLQPQPQLQLFDQPATEAGVRTALSTALLGLARSSTSKAERIALVDGANAVRPRSLW